MRLFVGSPTGKFHQSQIAMQQQVSAGREVWSVRGCVVRWVVFKIQQSGLGQSTVSELHPALTHAAITS